MIVEIEYSELVRASASLKNASKYCGEYANRLQKKVSGQLNSLSKGSSSYTYSALYFASSKIKLLENQRQQFLFVSGKIDDFIEEARNTDQRVANIMKREGNEFRKASGLSYGWADGLIQALTRFAIGQSNKDDFSRWIISCLRNDSETFDRWLHNLKHWYVCKGGKNILSEVSGTIGLIVAVLSTLVVAKNPIISSVVKIIDTDTIEDVDSAKPYVIASVLRVISPITGLLFITSGVAYGKTPSFYDTSRTPSSDADAGWLGYELSEGHPGITAWVGKANADIQSEWGYAGVNAYLGKAEAEADADFAFMETTKKKEHVDGKWIEKSVTQFVNAEAEAGASISIFAADADAGVGSDMLGIEGDAEGSVGNAKAEVKGKFSITEDGVNANVKGEAIVSAVEGKASGTINILGIEITGKIGGYAGALGVEGKVGVEDNKFVMEGGAAALLGISGGIEIGFNDEGWDNFVDFITFWD